MDNLNITLTPEMLALVPVVAAILQLVKGFDFVEKIKSYLPLVAMGLALGLAYATKMADPIVPAVIIGLTASGGYDLLKAPKKPPTPPTS